MEDKMRRVLLESKIAALERVQALICIELDTYRKMLESVPEEAEREA